MFTIFHIAKSAEIQNREKNMLLHYVDLYSDTENGKFLKKIDYKKFIYKWCYNMSLITVNGCWSIVIPNTIFLAPPDYENNVGHPDSVLYLNSRTYCFHNNTRIISFLSI